MSTYTLECINIILFCRIKRWYFVQLLFICWLARNTVSWPTPMILSALQHKSRYFIDLSLMFTNRLNGLIINDFYKSLKCSSWRRISPVIDAVVRLFGLRTTSNAWPVRYLLGDSLLGKLGFASSISCTIVGTINDVYCSPEVSDMIRVSAILKFFGEQPWTNEMPLSFKIDKLFTAEFLLAGVQGDKYS